MSRSAWTGIMSYGMVNVPSRLIAFEDSQDEPDVIRLAKTFDEFHERNKSKREFKLHQFMQQQHFFKTQSEFKSISSPPKHVFQIYGFVDTKQIDPSCFAKSFVLIPDHGATEPVALLIDAIAEKEVTGLGTIHMNNKASMCALRSHRGLLRVETLRPLVEISADSKPAQKALDETVRQALEQFEECVEIAEEEQSKATTGAE